MSQHHPRFVDEFNVELAWGNHCDLHLTYCLHQWCSAGVVIEVLIVRTSHMCHQQTKVLHQRCYHWDHQNRDMQEEKERPRDPLVTLISHAHWHAGQQELTLILSRQFIKCQEPNALKIENTNTQWVLTITLPHFQVAIGTWIVILECEIAHRIRKQL